MDFSSYLFFLSPLVLVLLGIFTRSKAARGLLVTLPLVFLAGLWAHIFAVNNCADTPDALVSCLFISKSVGGNPMNSPTVLWVYGWMVAGPIIACVAAGFELWHRIRARRRHECETFD